MTHDDWLAIILAIIGSGLLGTVLTNLSHWLQRRRSGHASADDVTALRGDIHEVNEKLDHDNEHMERIDLQLEEVSRHLKTQDEETSETRHDVLLQCLFARPRDQNGHRSAIESGKKYLARGWNGVGKIQYHTLVEDWENRAYWDDWNYDPHHHVKNRNGSQDE